METLWLHSQVLLFQMVILHIFLMQTMNISVQLLNAFIWILENKQTDKAPEFVHTGENKQCTEVKRLTHGHGTPAETLQLSSTPVQYRPALLQSHSAHGSGCPVLWSSPDGQSYRNLQSQLISHTRAKWMWEIIFWLVTHRVSTYAFSSTFHTLIERSWEALYSSWVPFLNERPCEGKRRLCYKRTAGITNAQLRC